MAVAFKIISGKTEKTLVQALDAWLLSAGRIGLVSVDFYRRDTPAEFLWDAMVAYFDQGVTTYRAAFVEADTSADVDTAINALIQGLGDNARPKFVRDMTPDRINTPTREMCALIYKTDPLPELHPQSTRLVPLRAVADIAPGATGSARLMAYSGELATLLTARNRAPYTWKAGYPAMAVVDPADPAVYSAVPTCASNPP